MRRFAMVETQAGGKKEIKIRRTDSEAPEATTRHRVCITPVSADEQSDSR